MFFSSDPQFKSPRGGRTLDDELTEALQKILDSEVFSSWLESLRKKVNLNPEPITFEEWMERRYPEMECAWEDGRYLVDGKPADWWQASYNEEVKENLRKWRYWITGDRG